jgi:hypothetical protein
MNPCPHCRADNYDDAKICRECGTELPTATKPELPAPPKQSASHSENEFISRSEKWGYWFTAWGGVVLIAFLLDPHYILTAPFFPIGLAALLPNGEGRAIRAWMSFGFIIGWALYILLSLAMFKTRKRNGFFVIYMIFCILLLLNLAGCYRTFSAVSHIQ